jgi:uncharacterized membrane protein YraQ (UPF0718 family)
MDLLVAIAAEAWRMLRESAAYVLLGIAAAGLMKVFLNPATVVRHLAGGRVLPVLKAAALGVPLPLCSCGVLPAAAGR